MNKPINVGVVGCGVGGLACSKGENSAVQVCSRGRNRQISRQIETDADGYIVSKGGARTNEHGEVLRPDGSVIAGLFAAGVAMANPIGTLTPAISSCRASSPSEAFFPPTSGMSPSMPIWRQRSVPQPSQVPLPL
mgnify:CR=1 FL=1